MHLGLEVTAAPNAAHWHAWHYPFLVSITAFAAFLTDKLHYKPLHDEELIWSRHACAKLSDSSQVPQVVLHPEGRPADNKWQLDKTK